MSDTEDGEYITVKKDASITIEPAGHISADNVDGMTFTFTDGVDITESVTKKNVKNKTPLSFTKKGRTAYTGLSPTAPRACSLIRFVVCLCTAYPTTSHLVHEVLSVRDKLFIAFRFAGSTLVLLPRLRAHHANIRGLDDVMLSSSRCGCKSLDRPFQ